MTMLIRFFTPSVFLSATLSVTLSVAKGLKTTRFFTEFIPSFHSGQALSLRRVQNDAKSDIVETVDCYINHLTI